MKIIYFVDLMQGSEFTCDKCHRSYKHKRTLRTHKKYGCENKKQFKCSECSQQCSLFENLKKHLLCKHGISNTMTRQWYMVSSTQLDYSN